jgi:hypothetical protein
MNVLILHRPMLRQISYCSCNCWWGERHRRYIILPFFHNLSKDEIILLNNIPLTLHDYGTFFHAITKSPNDENLSFPTQAFHRSSMFGIHNAEIYFFLSTFYMNIEWYVHKKFACIIFWTCMSKGHLTTYTPQYLHKMYQVGCITACPYLLDLYLYCI